MNKHTLSTCIGTLIGVGAVVGIAADVPTKHPSVTSLGDVKWGPAPPSLPSGAQATILAGDPASNGVVTLRLKFPAGYVIPPHTHPSDEHVTVLSGGLTIGTGDKVDLAKATTLAVGGYVVAPANVPHFAMTKDGAVVQIHLVGPFGITYSNPADDPGKHAGHTE